MDVLAKTYDDYEKSALERAALYLGKPLSQWDIFFAKRAAEIQWEAHQKMLAVANHPQRSATAAGEA